MFSGKKLLDHVMLDNLPFSQDTYTRRPYTDVTLVFGLTPGPCH
jgi:hypothetical protein